MKKERIDWDKVMDYIVESDYSWDLDGIKHCYQSYLNKEYVSFTAKRVIENAILPQIP